MLLKSFIVFSFILVATPAISSSLGQHESREQSDIILLVKVVSLDGCQATPPTIQRIKETAKELRLQIQLEQVIVRTPLEAEEHRHIGSPTVQINGVDIDPEAREITQFGIT